MDVVDSEFDQGRSNVKTEMTSPHNIALAAISLRDEGDRRKPWSHRSSVLGSRTSTMEVRYQRFHDAHGNVMKRSRITSQHQTAHTCFVEQ